jgi:hypothetical protein
MKRPTVSYRPPFKVKQKLAAYRFVFCEYLNDYHYGNNWYLVTLHTCSRIMSILYVDHQFFLVDECPQAFFFELAKIGSAPVYSRNMSDVVPMFP